MTARQQIARLLPLVLLLVLVIAGLRGVVPAPRWNGPLKADGVAIGIALEVVFGVLLLVVRARDAAARRVAESRPYDAAAADRDIEPPQALRFTLKYVLTVCLLGVAVVLLTDLHLHFFIKQKPVPPPSPQFHGTLKPQPKAGGGSLHIPLGPILYALLIALIVVAGWPGVVVVAAATAVIALLFLRGIIPRSAGQWLRQRKDKQRERAISGYAQRRFLVVTSLTSRPMYESDLRPVLEHILAARLAENHAVNLYTEPDEARRAFCRARGDANLWRWIDPARALDADERASKPHGIPGRTLARLITRLEQL